MDRGAKNASRRQNRTTRRRDIASVCKRSTAASRSRGGGMFALTARLRASPKAVPRLRRRILRRFADALPPRARMRRVVDLREVLEIEMRIDLRRRDVRVAQELLHRAKIARRFEQMARARMPHQVRIDA